MMCSVYQVLCVYNPNSTPTWSNAFPIHSKASWSLPAALTACANNGYSLCKCFLLSLSTPGASGIASGSHRKPTRAFNIHNISFRWLNGCGMQPLRGWSAIYALIVTPARNMKKGATAWASFIRAGDESVKLRRDTSWSRQTYDIFVLGDGGGSIVRPLRGA